MWIHLIDFDSTIPNLALMKISAHHQALGDKVTLSCGREVGFGNTEPDKIYASIIYKKNVYMAEGLHYSYPNSEIDIGGSGYDLEKVLPPEIENLKPDYDLYPDNDISIGFSSRGCLRKCHFCVVPQKEGRYRRTQHPSEWYNPDFKKIMFLDNNILADKEWFIESTNWCTKNNISMHFQSGFDIRLMDKDIAQLIIKLDLYKTICFAWDHIEDEKIIREKIQILRDVGFTDNMLHERVQFYVYVDSDEEFDSGVYRCRELKKLHCNAYVMFNIDNEATLRINDLREWANWRQFFWGCDIEEHLQKKNHIESLAYEDERRLVHQMGEIDDWV